MYVNRASSYGWLKILAVGLLHMHDGAPVLDLYRQIQGMKRELHICTSLDDWAAPARQVVMSRALLMFIFRCLWNGFWLMMVGALAILWVYIY